MSVMLHAARWAFCVLIGKLSSFHASARNANIGALDAEDVINGGVGDDLYEPTVPALSNTPMIGRASQQGQHGTDRDAEDILEADQKDSDCYSQFCFDVSHGHLSMALSIHPALVTYHHISKQSSARATLPRYAQ